jgi:hypothetical protein
MNYLRPASRTSIYLATMQLVIDRHFFSVLLEGRSFLPEAPSHIQDLVLPAGQRLCTKVLPEALLAGQAAVRSIIKIGYNCILIRSALFNNSNLQIQIRVEYCNWFQNHLNNDHLLDVSFFSDEAWFHLSEYVNSQNFRIWSAQNPHQFMFRKLAYG